MTQTIGQNTDANERASIGQVSSPRLNSVSSQHRLWRTESFRTPRTCQRQLDVYLDARTTSNLWSTCAFYTRGETDTASSDNFSNRNSCRTAEDSVLLSQRCSTFAAPSVKKHVDWVQREKAFNLCFSKGHRPEHCWHDRSCKKNGCQEKHHHLPRAAQPAESTVPVVVVIDQEYTAFMKMACVRVQGPEKAFDFIAYFDEARAITLMETSLA